MIYNRWGDKVTIVANLGQHQPKEFNAPATLVEIEFNDEHKSYAFVIFLKADGGWKEIAETTGTAPSVELSGKQLIQAIRRAL